MIRTYRYPLLPARDQEATLVQWLGACCDLYNGALQERREAWSKQRRGVSLYDQTSSLTEIRAADPAWAAVPVEVARSALRRLDRAMKAFFRRVKAGQRPGFPRFRSKRRYESFGFPFALRVLDGKVLVPKLGPVRFKEYRPLRGKVLDVLIRREVGKWFVCFQVDLGEAPAKPATVAAERAVGIDVGLSALATLSTGEAVENPRHLREAEAVIARRQRALSRKRRGSKGRRRAVLLVQKAHAHVRDQRLDGARKIACDLVRRFDLLAFEDLNVRGLCASPMAKSIHDAGWGVLLTAIACKAESAGKYAVAVDSRGTTQECSGCGAVVPKELSVRMHDCPRCGLVLNRDVNAALNVLARGRRAVSEASQEAEARSSALPR